MEPFLRHEGMSARMVLINRMGKGGGKKGKKNAVRLGGVGGVGGFERWRRGSLFSRLYLLLLLRKKQISRWLKGRLSPFGNVTPRVFLTDKIRGGVRDEVGRGGAKGGEEG